MSRTGLLNAVLRHPRPIIALWVAASVLGLALASGLTENLKGGGFTDSGADSERARRQLAGFAEDPSIVLTVESTGSRVDGAPFRRYVARLERAVREGAEGARATSYYQLGDPRLVSPDRRALLVPVTVPGGADEAIDAEHALRGALPAPPPGFRLGSGGYPAFSNDVNETSREDLERAERIGIPIVALVLVATLGGVVAASLPLLLAIGAVALMLGSLALVGRELFLSEFVTNAATMVGIAVGVDYSLFMLSRYRQELAAGAMPRTALVTTWRTIGRAVVVAGSAIVIALLVSFPGGSPALRSVGLGMALAVVFAVIAAVLVLPAAMSLLGPRLAGRRGAISSWPHVWERFVAQVVRRPVAYATPALALLLLASVPALQLHDQVKIPSADILPPSAWARQARAIAQRHFGAGAATPVYAVTALDRPGRTPAGLREAGRIGAAIEADPRVAEVASLASAAGRGDSPLGTAVSRELLLRYFLAEDGKTTRFVVVPRAGPDAEATKDLVDDLRAGALPGLGGRQLSAAGETAEGMDAVETVFGGLLPLVVLLAVGGYAVLLFTFRSILIPLKATLLAMLSVTASFGILTLLFGTAAGRSLVGASVPDVSPLIPVSTIVLVFAISMDYEVVILTRIRERYLDSGDTAGSIVEGLSRTGPVVTSAAAIMVAVFLAFALADIEPVKQLGFALAIAVLLDATLVRLILLPATMKLLGEWNWWMPGGLSRQPQGSPVDVSTRQVSSRK